MDKPAMGRNLLWRMRVLSQLPRSGADLDHLQTLAELLNAEPPKGPDHETDAAEQKRLISGDTINSAVSQIENHVRAHTTSLPAPSPHPVTNTTHMVTADRNGMVVSLTQSLGPFFGAKVALPKYGVTFAATMGYLDDEDVSQGPVSSISPTLVLDATGQPILAVGAAGSDRIPGVILQVIHNALDRGMSIEQAVAEPRISIDKDAKKGIADLLWEAMGRSGSRELAAGLQTRGITVQPVEPGQALGRVHALMRDASGVWHGAADPRWFGSAVGPALWPSKRS
jgi:gamma-glutamyltranspeptidase/glutathione hydrolase